MSWAVIDRPYNDRTRLRHRMGLEKTQNFLAPVERIGFLATIWVLRDIDCSAPRNALTAAARHFVTMFEKFEKSTITPNPSTVSVVGIAGSFLRARQCPTRNDKILHRGHGLAGKAVIAG